jgi:hypothetical protein
MPGKTRATAAAAPAAAAPAVERWALSLPKEYLDAVVANGPVPLSIALPVGRHKDLPKLPLRVDLTYKLHPTRSKCRRYVIRASVEVQSMRKVPRDSVSAAALGIAEEALALLDGKASASLHIWSLRSAAACEKGDGMHIIEATQGGPRPPWLHHVSRPTSCGPLRGALTGSKATSSGAASAPEASAHACEDEAPLVGASGPAAPLSAPVATAGTLAEEASEADGTTAEQQPATPQPAVQVPSPSSRQVSPDRHAGQAFVPESPQFEPPVSAGMAAVPKVEAGQAFVPGSPQSDSPLSAGMAAVPKVEAGQATAPELPQPDSPVSAGMAAVPEVEAEQAFVPACPQPDSPLSAGMAGMQPRTPPPARADTPASSLSARWSCPVPGEGCWDIQQDTCW